MRINKFIASNTFLSRRKADEAIQKGKVLVNGNICTSLGTDISPKDKVTIAGNVIKNKEKQKVLYAFNKPTGVVCSEKRQFNEKIVKDFFKDVREKLILCGRLDKDTSGLLLLTNDGDVSNKVIHPSSSITKEYTVETKEDLSKEDLINLGKEREINGKKVIPAKVRKLKPFKTSISIYEGINHQVRQIYSQCNLNITSLHRTRVGNIKLGKLEEGQYKILPAENI